LEYLAYDFAHNGMSIKKLHRKIMLSATYQLSTEPNEADAAKDEANRLYWRANQRRMTAEQLRDSFLAVAGTLDDSMGGPSAQLSPTYNRRTIYGRVSRFKLDTFLQTFDYPNPASSAEKRFTTTVPLQRLFLMNSDFMQLRAEELVRRTDDESDSRTRIRKLYILIYGREPSEVEITKGLAYVRTEPLRSYEESAKASSENQSDSSSKTWAGPTSESSESVASSSADPVSARPTMMSGLGGPDGDPTLVRYDATVWGRYAKLLLGSSEFIYIN
jgi:hypothetical protein